MATTKARVIPTVNMILYGLSQHAVRKLRKRWAAIGFSGLAVLVAACGSSGNSQGLVSRGYLAKGPSGIAFVQLTVKGTSLNGTLDGASLNGTQVQTEHDSFSGSSNADNLTLTLSDNLGNTTNISGSISGDTLVLNIPKANGQISSATFSPSDTDTYNAAVASLQAQASNAVVQKAQAAVQASADAANYAQQIIDKEQATCQRVGGKWGTAGIVSPGNGCQIKYLSSDGKSYNYTVSFDTNGNVIPNACADTEFAAKNGCGTPESVQQAQANCVSGAANYGSPGTWHPDTDICSL